MPRTLRPGDNVSIASPGPGAAVEGVQQPRVAQQPAPNTECFQEMEEKHSDFKQPFHGSHGTGKNWWMNHCSQHMSSRKSEK